MVSTTETHVTTWTCPYCARDLDLSQRSGADYRSQRVCVDCAPILSELGRRQTALNRRQAFMQKPSPKVKFVT
jgi:glutaredoxin